MNLRTKRIVASAAAVILAFCAYRLIAVPWIEPGPEVTQTSSVDALPTRSAADAQLAALKPYFRPGSWELDNPIVLEGEQAKILFKEYENTPDGRVRLNPCTVLMLPAGQTASSDRSLRYVVMEAPQGAILQFDKPLDLSKAQIGQLQNGIFAGPITIHGMPKQQDGPEDLLVVTRDVQLTGNRLWTPHEVDFRMGLNHGHGRDLRIDLLQSPSTGKKMGLNIGGIQAMELARDVVMHLQPGEGGMLPGDHPAAKPAPAAAGQPLAANPPPVAPQPPVDVRCAAEFRFDLVDYIATFNKQVDAVRVNPQGPADRLQCDLLTIYFAPRLTPGAPPPKTGSIPPLEPRRFEARGRPATVESPSTGSVARGERLEYDIHNGKLTLESPDQVFLRQKVNEIHARTLVYQRDESGALLRVVATGPGWFRGAQGDAAAAQFEGRFAKELRVRPYEQEQVASLSGNAELKFIGEGLIGADELHLWFLPPPKSEPSNAAVGPANNQGPIGNRGGASTPKAAGPSATPDRLLAVGNVRIASQQLSGNTSRLEAWFKAAPALPTPLPSVGAASGLARNDAARPGGLAAGQPAGPPAAKQHFDLSGDLIRTQFLLRPSATEVDNLSVDGKVVMVETQTAQAGDVPLQIHGDHLQVLQAQAPEMSLSVTGNQSRVEARGLIMEGDNVRMNRAANRVWIDGPGRMTLPMDHDANGAPLSKPRPLAITWKQNMDFNGLTARFNREVAAQNDDQLLQTEILNVTLDKRVDFAQSQVPAAAGSPQSRAQVEKIQCEGGATLVNRTVDQGQLLSLDRMQLRDLAVIQSTGAITGQGPGWATSVRHGGDNGLDQLPGAAPATPASNGGAIARTAALPDGSTRNPAAPAPSRATKPAGGPDGDLVYINVTFQRGISGNLHTHEMTFFDHVRTIYGPVKTWTDTLDPDNPAGLGPREMLLNSDQLKLVQMQPRADVKPSNEMEALGNTLVEGATFTARSHRLTYTQEKGLLILEGDGRNDAQLYRQEIVGGPESRAAARKIFYWPATRRVEVDDARFIDLSQMNTAAPRSAPPAGTAQKTAPPIAPTMKK